MANMTTGASLANGNKRVNRAKAQVDGRFVSNFGTGQSMATDRQNPMESNKNGAIHLSRGV